ncbi:uncharacterized protein BDZ99DRAFT_202669 [Mytilinidion resinicola]|uniref:Uncharacterized protein n=1 Tax=Mytilinidion resinicola TaxID=574789 RepID=A0A6A6Y1I8_9PEZI|nr:uncharacterized protein BDZ99DRAFT_202669 [Mytilinidion resinicola]KAF2802418.1 hypothetical protein BDZ99DRAFT_202669 [Mytilinidion resinicola]
MPRAAGPHSPPPPMPPCADAAKASPQTPSSPFVGVASPARRQVLSTACLRGPRRAACCHDRPAAAANAMRCTLQRRSQR